LLRKRVLELEQQHRNGDHDNSYHRLHRGVVPRGFLSPKSQQNQMTHVVL
jgi:hypothetical protein